MGGLNHILLEAFCLKDSDEHAHKERPDYCPGAPCLSDSELDPGYACFLNGCPFLDFTSCENTICFSDQRSEMGYGILFSPEMTEAQQQTFEEIATRKINEAYEECISRHVPNR